MIDVYTYVSLPHHGYLLVPLQDVIEVGMLPHYFSPHSFMQYTLEKPVSMVQRILALEEDWDMHLFLEARRETTGGGALIHEMSEDSETYFSKWFQMPQQPDHAILSDKFLGCLIHHMVKRKQKTIQPAIEAFSRGTLDLGVQFKDRDHLVRLLKVKREQERNAES